MTIRIVVILVLCCGAAVAAETDAPRCASSQFTIDTNFEGGALDECNARSDGSFDITIRQEDDKVIVEQPWFAFRVTAKSSGKLRIRLQFPDAYARYWPKLSNDGETWTRTPDTAVEVSESKKDMQVSVDVGAGQTWIAAQELLTSEWYDEWLATLADHDEIKTAVIGQSNEGRPIRLAKTANKPEVVLLIGRQHPAEVPGAMAMRDFVDTVMADTELARQFRLRYCLLIVPFLNPDGVANGHWRHNSGRTDLNRDWGTFKQPETLAVAALLNDVEKLDMRPRLMLDFHATKFTDTLLFYTQAAEEKTDPARFDINWFANVRERLPGFDFKHDPRPSATNPNTKGYFYRTYGIPAFTYELGDEADRDVLHATTPIFAEEMMRELLSRKPQVPGKSQ